MSNSHDTNEGPDRPGQDARSDDTIARLLNLAGPRDAVPADLERRVHDRVRQEWRQSIARRRTARWYAPLALAASVLIAITAIVLMPDEIPDGVSTPVAKIVRINGETTANRLAVDDPVYAGETITTAAGQGIALRMNSDLSLRIAGETTVTVDSAEAVTLVSGHVYADSGRPAERNRSMTIITDGGIATDRGTQFAVFYRQNEMSVTVREGRVDVSGGNRTWTAESGDRLVLRPNSDAVFERVSKYDDSWAWAVALAPAFDIQNRPLHEFLEWAARETGKELEYASDNVRADASRTYLNGSVSGLAPSEALPAVLATTQFGFTIGERRITIGE